MLVDHEFLALKGNLTSYLYRLTANKQDAEDLLHDTFIRVKEKHNTFKGNSSFKTWVFAIATNLARDNARVKRRWGINAQDLCKAEAQANPETEQRIDRAFHTQPESNFEITEHISYCFTCLSKNLALETQIAIILKDVYDFSRDEIAGILGKTEGVVKHLLHEGRKELQTKFKNRCALINKTGACYQCAELNDWLQKRSDASDKIAGLKLNPAQSDEKNYELRVRIVKEVNPLTGKGANVEDTILQILNEVLDRKQPPADTAF